MKNLRCAFRTEVIGLQNFVYEVPRENPPAASINSQVVSSDSTITPFEMAASLLLNVDKKLVKNAAEINNSDIKDRVNMVIQLRDLALKSDVHTYKSSGLFEKVTRVNMAPEYSLVADASKFKNYVKELLASFDHSNESNWNTFYSSLTPELQSLANSTLDTAAVNAESIKSANIENVVAFLDAVSKSGATARVGELAQFIKARTGFNIGSNGGAIDGDEAREALGTYSAFDRDVANGIMSSIIEKLPERYDGIDYRKNLWEQLPSKIKGLKVFESLDPAYGPKIKGEKPQVTPELVTIERDSEQIRKIEDGFLGLAKYARTGNKAIDKTNSELLLYQVDILKRSENLNESKTMFVNVLNGVLEDHGNDSGTPGYNTIVLARNKASEAENMDDFITAVYSLGQLSDSDKTSSGVAEAKAATPEGKKAKKTDRTNPTIAETSAANPAPAAAEAATAAPNPAAPNMFDTTQAPAENKVAVAKRQVERTRVFLTSLDATNKADADVIRALINKGDKGDTDSQFESTKAVQREINKKLKEKGTTTLVKVDGWFGNRCYEAIKLTDMLKPLQVEAPVAQPVAEPDLVAEAIADLKPVDYPLATGLDGAKPGELVAVSKDIVRNTPKYLRIAKDSPVKIVEATQDSDGKLNGYKVITPEGRVIKLGLNSLNLAHPEAQTRFIADVQAAYKAKKEAEKLVAKADSTPITGELAEVLKVAGLGDDHVEVASNDQAK